MKVLKRLAVGIFPLMLVLQAQGQLLNKLKNAANQEINKLATQKANPSNGNKLSNNVTRSVAVTLQGEEYFDYSENCIDLGASIDQVSFILTKGRGDQSKCFSYKNGSRVPVPCPTNVQNCGSSLQCSYNKLREISITSDEINQYVTYQKEEHAVATPAISDEQMKTMAAYMTKEQLEAVKKQLAEAAKQTQGQTYSEVKSCTINFNGKKYGPFKNLSSFFLTGDRRHFFAVVMEDSKDGYELRYRVITSVSSATIVTTSSVPTTKILVAPDYSEFAMLNMTLDSKFTIMTSTGKSHELANGLAVEDAWYSPVGNHIITVTQNQLFSDGQLIKTFENYSKPQPCDMFLSPDGKSLTVIKENVISFADGDTFKYPLKIAIVNIGGKNYFKWLALEDRELVVYQKPY